MKNKYKEKFLTLVFIILLSPNSFSELTQQQKAKLDNKFMEAYNIYIASIDTSLKYDDTYFRKELSRVAQLISIDTTVSPFIVDCFIGFKGECNELTKITGIILGSKWSDFYTAKIPIDKVPDVSSLDCVIAVKAASSRVELFPMEDILPEVGINFKTELTPEQKKKLHAYMIIAYEIYSKNDTEYVKEGVKYGLPSLSTLAQIVAIDTTVSPFKVRCFIRTTDNCNELSKIPGVNFRRIRGSVHTANISIDQVPTITALPCVLRIEASGFQDVLEMAPKQKGD